MPRRTRGTGGYTPPEKHIVITASTYQGGGHPVIVWHGGGGDATQYEPVAQRRDLHVLADSGLVVCAADLGGGHTWGNDEGGDAATAMLAWLAAGYGTDNSRVALVGDSAGALGCLNWAVRNPDVTAAVVVRVPAVALGAMHARNVAGMATQIAAAYGGTGGLAAALPTHDPSHASMVAAQQEFGVDKIRAFYDTADPIVLPAEVEAWAEATGVDLVPFSDAGTHEPWSHVRRETQASWIWARIRSMETRTA